jgi:hypothetical protein
LGHILPWAGVRTESLTKLPGKHETLASLQRVGWRKLRGAREWLSPSTGRHSQNPQAVGLKNPSRNIQGQSAMKTAFQKREPFYREGEALLRKESC